ncbi:MAG: AglZ/HisF2 family acetamidino modification protein [Ignavibacteria bacterium]|nr:AglZ/HisF2 family acetamidino modification protein [Ignavibacteria bacterium]
MLKTRIIPCLLLKDKSLVKTVNFRKFNYIGDPVNTCRIFNELEVDELAFLDIRASLKNQEPQYEILQEIANECFMPVSYGGGIRTMTQAEKIFRTGFEKIVINSSAFTNPGFITEAAKSFGSQSIIVSIDVKKNIFGKYQVCSYSATKTENNRPEEWLKEVESLGAGEILLTSVDREGTWNGFDLDLIKMATSQLRIPLIAHGGGGSLHDISDAVKKGNASAVALGSMVVYQRKGFGVLVNFPENKVLQEIL